MSYKKTIKNLIAVTKPGILMGNIITTVGGYCLSNNFVFLEFIFIIFGTLFIMASGCVFNNYIDRDIDAIMERTKNRVLVTGELSYKTALIYACILGFIGLIFLLSVNVLVALIGIVGFFVYVFGYSLYAKRQHFGVVIGSISGATPILIGYVGGTYQINITAFLLLFMMIFWQIAHSYSISIFRLNDYKNAKINVLALHKTFIYIKYMIIANTFLACIFSLAVVIYNKANIVFIIFNTFIAVYWLSKSIKSSINQEKWAKSTFLSSILFLILVSLIYILIKITYLFMDLFTHFSF